MPDTPITIESLQKQVDHLTKLVEKQNKIILSTGEKLMQLQLQHQRDKHMELEAKNKHFGEPSTDFVTNEDIVQLVGELQGQLLTLDYKSFGRVANSTMGSHEPLEVIPNHDGEYPPESIFPSTKQDFEDFDNLKVFILARFYELLPPSSSDEVDEIFIKHFDNLAVDEKESKTLESEMDLLLPETSDRDSLFNKLAMYLGLGVRK